VGWGGGGRGGAGGGGVQCEGGEEKELQHRLALEA